MADNKFLFFSARAADAAAARAAESAARAARRSAVAAASAAAAAARDALMRPFVAARAAAIAAGAAWRHRRLALALVCIVAAGLARAARESATANVSVPATDARVVTACDYTVAEGQGRVRVEGGARDAADAAAAACSVTVSASASPAPSVYPDGPLKVLNDQLYEAAYTVAFGMTPDPSATPPPVLAEIDATYACVREQGTHLCVSESLPLPSPPSHPAPPPSGSHCRDARVGSAKRVPCAFLKEGVRGQQRRTNNVP